MATQPARNRTTKSMASRYKAPPNEKRVQTNFRLPVSLRKKLEIAAMFWRARAEGEAEDVEVVEAIDMTYTAITLLGESVDLELAEFGGMPTGEAALREAIERIKKKAAKK